MQGPAPAVGAAWSCSTRLVSSSSFSPPSSVSPASAAAVDFPPVTDEERALQKVAGEPNAPAVVLSKNAEFWMMDLAAPGRLLAPGLAHAHQDPDRAGQGPGRGRDPAQRLRAPEPARGADRAARRPGRCRSPRRRKFERRLSRTDKRFVTSVAFPGVEVGAILDYEYELRFDTFYYLEPWYLSEEIPVRRAEIVYHVPAEMGVQAWSRDPFKAGLSTDTARVAGGGSQGAGLGREPPGGPRRAVRPAVRRPRDADPAAARRSTPTRSLNYPLMESWASTSELILEEQYEKARRKDGARRRARRASSPAAAAPREKAEALYRFVRDEIANEDLEGVTLREDATVDGVLARGSGDSADKALLLQRMLQSGRHRGAAGLGRRAQPRHDRSAGRQPGLVPPRAGGGRASTASASSSTPSDRALGFGRLQPDFEGTPALIPDGKKPEAMTLPATPFDQNRPRAAVDLALDDDGRRLRHAARSLLTGHHAWSKIDWQESRDQELEAWKEWLQEAFDGLPALGRQGGGVGRGADGAALLGDGAAGRGGAGRRGRAWRRARRSARRSQPFALPGSARRSPVLFAFADRDEVELQAALARGLEARRRSRSRRGTTPPAGASRRRSRSTPPARALTYRRRWTSASGSSTSREQYEAVRGAVRARRRRAMRRRWCWSAASLARRELCAWLLPASPRRAGARRRSSRSRSTSTSAPTAPSPSGRASRSGSTIGATTPPGRPIRVYLDDHRRLTRPRRLGARAPTASAQGARRRTSTPSQCAGDGELHSSQKLRTVPSRAVPVGSVLSLDYEVEERPYFPLRPVALGAPEPIERLRGRGARRRRRLALAPGRLAAGRSPSQETAGGVAVTGARLPPVVAAASSRRRRPARGAVLRYAWGEERDW